MRCLYVLYDARCGLCRWARDWASRRAAFVPLVFVEAGSDEARRRFPSLWKPGPPEELVVVSDEGHVYRDDAAWIMCLYALVETREWALRLASPMLRPLARQAFLAVSQNRLRISHWLGLDDRGMASRLQLVQAPACDREGRPAASRLQSIHAMISGPQPPDPDGTNGEWPLGRVTD
jgi:predicted DCC family thiol-disulfide oxidoreductase YuxK